MTTRSKERIKQTGEVFTPIPLVDEILDELPPEVFTDPEKTFLDPACGDGNFLVRVLQRKIDNGTDPTQALLTTYGVELMEDNVIECRNRLLAIAGNNKLHQSIVKRTIVRANALTEWDFDNWCYKS